MRVVLGTERLENPGGSETYVLTLAEHLARLGADVTILAPRQGMAADWARERGTAVVGTSGELPRDPDATLAFGAVVATDLAAWAPGAMRLYVAHNMDEPHLPPPVSGIVAATIAPNERLASIARGHVGTGEVIRMTQPIDTRRFSARGGASPEPRRVLMLGNYRAAASGRMKRLREAWGDAGFEWVTLGDPDPTMEPVAAVGEADIVVGYGRSILEAMACGRPAYVHEHSGSDGWVTAENYAALEADGFSGALFRTNPDAATLRADLELYDPAMGQVNQDLVRRNHDARIHAAEVMTLIKERHEVVAPPGPEALQAIRVMASNWIRAEQAADRYLYDMAAVSTEFRQFKETRRFRLAAALVRPVDNVKKLLGR